jgi:hypothetical protein
VAVRRAAQKVRPSGSQGFLAGNLILRLSFLVAGNARIFGLASSEAFCGSGHTQDEACWQISESAGAKSCVA